MTRFESSAQALAASAEPSKRLVNQCCLSSCLRIFLLTSGVTYVSAVLLTPSVVSDSGSRTCPIPTATGSGSVFCRSDLALGVSGCLRTRGRGDDG